MRFAFEHRHSHFYLRVSFSRSSYQLRSSKVSRSAGLGAEIDHLSAEIGDLSAAIGHLLLKLDGRGVDRTRHLDIKLLLMFTVCASGLCDGISFSSHSRDGSIEVGDVWWLIMFVGHNGYPANKVEAVLDALLARVFSDKGVGWVEKAIVAKRACVVCFVYCSLFGMVLRSVR